MHILCVHLPSRTISCLIISYESKLSTWSSIWRGCCWICITIHQAIFIDMLCTNFIKKIHNRLDHPLNKVIIKNTGGKTRMSATTGMPVCRATKLQNSFFIDFLRFYYYFEKLNYLYFLFCMSPDFYQFLIYRNSPRYVMTDFSWISKYIIVIHIIKST